MRKNNDGYVIIYVVFVVLFLCIVAVGTCTVAVSNLKTQASYTEQLQDKYEAEGAIEKFMAEVCANNNYRFADDFTSENLARAKAQEVVEGYIYSSASNLGIILSESKNWSYTYGGPCVCTLTVSSKHKNSKITAGIEFDVIVNIEPYQKKVGENEDGTDKMDKRFKYSITAVTSKYISYTVASSGGEP